MKDFEASFVEHQIQPPVNKTNYMNKSRLEIIIYNKLALPKSITIILSEFKIVFNL